MLGCNGPCAKGGDEPRSFSSVRGGVALRGRWPVGGRAHGAWWCFLWCSAESPEGGGGQRLELDGLPQSRSPTAVTTSEGSRVPAAAAATGSGAGAAASCATAGSGTGTDVGQGTGAVQLPTAKGAPPCSPALLRLLRLLSAAAGPHSCCSCMLLSFTWRSWLACTGKRHCVSGGVLGCLLWPSTRCSAA